MFGKLWRWLTKSSLQGEQLLITEPTIKPKSVKDFFQFIQDCSLRALSVHHVSMHYDVKDTAFVWCDYSSGYKLGVIYTYETWVEEGFPTVEETVTELSRQFLELRTEVQQLKQ